MTNLLSAAYKYIDNGICVIPTGINKKSTIAWTPFQEKIITKEEAEKYFKNAECLAIVCGRSSGNLEVIDLDIKYDLTSSLYERYTQAIKDNVPGLIEKLLIIQTRTGGYHFYYRCDQIEGNQKLARRSSTSYELEDDPNDKVKVLIETRGKKGYVIAPPSKGYKTIQGSNIPNINAEERDILLSLARTFNELIDEPIKAHKQSTYNPKDFGLSPFEDYNKRGNLATLLEKHGWKVISDSDQKTVFRRPGKTEGTSGNWNKEKNWFSVFTTSSIFDAQRAYLPYAVYCILECKGDFKLCAKDLLDAGYGEKRVNYGQQVERDIFKKKQEGLTRPEMIQYVTALTKKNDGEAEDILNHLENVWGEKIQTFWEVSSKGKATINRTKLVNFLHTHGGYSLYYYNIASTIFKIVKCQDGFVEEIATEDLKKFLQQYVNSLPDTFDGGITGDELMEEVLRGANTLFSDSILEFLPRSEFDFLKDTISECFIPFKNGVVVITEDTITLKKYLDIKKVIWRSQVKDYEIRIEPELQVNTVEYFKFLQLISGEDMGRVEYALTLIGYLLHGYKDPTKAFAVVLAEEIENEKEGGGTGKGIFFNAITHLIPHEIIDGKAFKMDKTFAFQRVGLDTRLVVFQDVKKNIDFELFYPMITDGMTVEKKNKDELFIQYADSPKIGFTTNYTVKAVGNHGKRRQRVFEFAGFFNPAQTPEDYFGHKLFSDWDPEEWNRFFNLMFVCVRLFMENGIKESGVSESNKRKQIRLEFGEEFLEWLDENLEDLAKGYKFFMDCYKDFLQSADFVEKDYSMKKFKTATISATDSLGLTTFQCKNRSANNSRMICVRMKGQPEPQKANYPKQERIDVAGSDLTKSWVE